MDGFSVCNDNSPAIRGYILRCLVRGYHFSYIVRQLSNKLMSDGLIVEPDISKYLYYLEQSRLIEFTDTTVNAFNAYEKDAVVRLTIDGIRFIENGGNPEMGIDL